MAQARKKRSRRSVPVDYQTYIFRLDDWEPSYSFATNAIRWCDGPYWEHSALIFRGEILSPTKVKSRVGTLTVMGDRRDTQAVENPTNSDRKPLCVGSLTIRGDQTEFLGSIPQDALWGLIAAFGAGKLRIVDLHGDVLRRGKALIRSVRFYRDVDPEDLE